MRNTLALFGAELELAGDQIDTTAADSKKRVGGSAAGRRTGKLALVTKTPPPAITWPGSPGPTEHARTASTFGTGERPATAPKSRIGEPQTKYVLWSDAAPSNIPCKLISTATYASSARPCSILSPLHSWMHPSTSSAGHGELSHQVRQPLHRHPFYEAILPSRGELAQRARGRMQRKGNGEGCVRVRSCTPASNQAA